MNQKWSRSQWEAEISAVSPIQQPLKMVDAIRRIDTSTVPYMLADENENVYVVKCRLRNRPTCSYLVTEQIVARIGVAMGAPVVQPALVYVGQDLISNNTNIFTPSSTYPGIAHATLYVKHCTDSDFGDRLPNNRIGYALLTYLYELACCQTDHQVIINSAKQVLSVDHGECFYNGPDWSIETLQNTPCQCIYESLSEKIELTRRERDSAIAAVAGITNSQIAEAVAAPPTEWQVDDECRLTLAELLALRRDSIVEKHSA